MLIVYTEYLLCKQPANFCIKIVKNAITIINSLVCQRSSPVSPILFYLPKNVLTVFLAPRCHFKCQRQVWGAPSGTEALSDITTRAA